ncbi:MULTISPECIES: serine/threonine phosphatase [unclassified Coleofasciculus]|uniref:serine/threonine phosphatase n=1 Tax=unclassified Coleofasciculus TaxID=2692782 RepID=UPI00187FC3D4|nr:MULTISPECIES: serine/threonine phosphatase [unclassified Coleofasciculus]MBE9127870.1 serine/threonine phosphatase [Coleofasciculus sp. LEGE 07081]MBE9149642.1 serine/threonine phosphatase [Coleofasciculus sp. LEGE 07092]
MLICPQCQFENPNTNKFCQRCGTSLTHKTCHECGAQVLINAKTCHKCDSFVGTVWWAIIYPESDFISSTAPWEPPQEVSKLVTNDVTTVNNSQQQAPVVAQSELPSVQALEPEAVSERLGLEPDNSDVAQSSPLVKETPEELSIGTEGAESQETVASSASPISNPPETASQTSTAVYLDPQQRYQLLEPLTDEKIAASRGGCIAVRVLDCQPFQKSLLEALIEQQEGDPNLQPPNILGIPAVAQPYLALKESHYPTIPSIHDAWQQDGKAIVLLEDRSEWELLSEVWGNQGLPTLQILYWLDEMARLWQGLEPWHCCQSLLELVNLRVDEDQVLGLICLYQDSENQQSTLKDLGQLWRMLFNNSQRTQLNSLGVIFRQLSTGEMETVEELRSQLEALAHAEEMSKAQEVAPTLEEMSVSPSLEIDTFSTQEDNSNSYDDGGPTVVLPMQLLSLDDVGSTHIGYQRDHNEDCYGIQTWLNKQENPTGRTLEARGLYILCDGMGGHAAGEVASSMAVETIKQYFRQTWQDQLPIEESIRSAVRVTNQTIYDVNQQNARSGSGRMGTTLAMMLIQDTNAAIAHVGDSRIYRLTRKGGLEQLSIDHKVGQREIKRGVEPDIAYSRADANQLTQALGPRGEKFVKPDVLFLELNEDTLFILCSDGLSDNDLIENHWQTHLAPLLSSRSNLEQGVLQLIELANEHNGHDNITAILIRVKVRPNFQQQLW